jgi:tetratricopeptide (TPR) repeat protein
MKGSVLIGKGEYDKARQCFEEAAKIFPNDPDIKICMAICDARKKQKSKAIENMNVALKLAPMEVRILVAASLLSYELNDENKGTEYIKKAMEINPYATYEYWEAAAKGFLSNPSLGSSDKQEIKDLISENKSLLTDIKGEEESGKKKKK